MKRFLLVSFLWAIVLLVVFLGIEAYLNLHKDKLDYLIGKEVITALYKSKEKAGKKTLVLGDSVCNQLYSSNKEYDGLVSLACNRVISMAGHYFLLKNYLITNSDSIPGTVVLILHPVSIQCGLDRYAYHYMLKNFMNAEYKADFNDVLWGEIHKIPAYWSASLPFIRVSNYSPDYDIKNEKTFTGVSAISRSYFEKMIQLSNDYHFDLLLRCPPIDMNREQEVKRFFEMNQDGRGIPEYYMEGYIQSATFVKDIIVDGLHFRTDCIPSDFMNLL